MSEIYSYLLTYLLKIFRGDIFYPRFGGKQESSACFTLTTFKILTGWATTPNVCVIYPNSMISLPVQLYALCTVLSGVILSFRTKCLIMPHVTKKIFRFRFDANRWGF